MTAARPHPHPPPLTWPARRAQVTAADLVSVEGLAPGFREADVRLNINVALTYMESWLRFDPARLCFFRPAAPV
jgi:hypothetical protein